MRFTPWALATGALALSAGLVCAQDKPAELKIGISTFTSGAASVFGVQPRPRPNC